MLVVKNAPQQEQQRKLNAAAKEPRSDVAITGRSFSKVYRDHDSAI